MGGGTNVTCYKGIQNETTSCPIGSLNENAKIMIDNHTWNTGAPDYNELNDDTTKTYDTLGFYNAERGSLNGKICTNNTEFCNDTVTRTTTWTGYVALPYVSDWAYASSEDDCNIKIDISSTHKCKNSNWMHDNNNNQWVLSPQTGSSVAWFAWRIDIPGGPGYGNVSDFISFRPTVYLKSNVKIVSGTGTSSNPYKLEI